MEFIFIDIFQVMGPIAMSIDNLQSSADHYATFLPTLHGLKADLQALGQENLEYCGPLLKELVHGFSKRFARFFDLNDEQCQAATIAACVHPFFKMRWIHPDYQQYTDKIQDMVVKAALETEISVKIKKEDNINSKSFNLDFRFSTSLMGIFYISIFFFIFRCRKESI